jgi:hypothetical protein
MYREWSEPQLFDLVGNESAVHAATHSDDAIILLPHTVFLDLGHDLLEPSLPFLTREYLFLYHLVIGKAVITYTVLVELDVRI